MGLVSSYLCNCSLWEQRECDIQYTHTGCVHDNYDLYPVSYSWTVASFSIFSKKDCITPISTIAPFLVCDRLLSVLPASLSSSHFMTISYELKSFFVLNDLGLQPFLQIRAQGGKKRCVCVIGRWLLTHQAAHFLSLPHATGNELCPHNLYITKQTHWPTRNHWSNFIYC